MKVGLTTHNFEAPPTLSCAASSASPLPSKYSLKNSGSQLSLHASTSLLTETKAALFREPPLSALLNAFLFASPFPFLKTSGSVPTTPRHETTQSGFPTTASTALASADRKSTDFHWTESTQSAPFAQSGIDPDLDMLVTSAPPSTSSLATREPTKPVPPKTLTESDETEANAANNTATRIISTNNKGVRVAERCKETGGS
mmetsp:Transcript_7613/g.17451  ORF Transcript_7613/g.17451 Transcript_7613/m.17451 type:complete len:201 (-) Transcript_7613:41-643(-)